MSKTRYPCGYSLAIDDAVWIEHGHDLEDELLTQRLGRGLVAEQVVDRTLHHPAGVALARVHAPRQEDVRTVPCKPIIALSVHQ